MNKETGKKNAALEAAQYVKRDMTLGLGTGSTAKYFVEALAPLIAKGWNLKGVPTSEETKKQAQEIGLDIIEPDETTIIDLAVDGTDEADPNLNLIKGGGGAHLREKIVARAAHQFIVIADKSKRVVKLGAFPLPIEVEPFGWAITVGHIRRTLEDLGYASAPLNLRAVDGALVHSDGGHLLLDCALTHIDDPHALDKALSTIPGVIETGLFCGVADMVIYGDEDEVTIDKAPQ